MQMLGVACAGATQRFEATHESLAGYGVPQWYQDGKLGIYMHWAPFSVPAFQTEWYPRWMYVEGNPVYEHHIKTWGSLNKFGYKDFIPMFKGERFDADAYVRLFKEAGARYVIFIPSHELDFSLSSTSLTDYKSKRDYTREVAEACARKGLAFGLYVHLATGMLKDCNHLLSGGRRAEFGRIRVARGKEQDAYLDAWLT